ncbi:MAG: alpha/beta hydrolase [Chloroflexi bacterium]|nr:alpha/beta hydrolase [Chloroflexota bacterium]
MIVNGLQTNVKVIGEGFPVLFLHGWGGDMTSFEGIASQIASAGFECHLLDLPGFGETQLAPEPWGVPQYAQWVMAYVNQAGIEKMHLVGHSFGGRVSLILGAEQGEKIEKIVLSNSAGVKLPPSMNIRIYYIVRRVLFTILSIPGLGGLKERLRAYFRQKYGSADYLNAGPLLETFKLVIGQDLREYARRIQAPTLLFWGDLDEETPLEIGRILEEEIPDAALILFEGAGHFAYLDRPGEFVRVVTHFFTHE